MIFNFPDFVRVCGRWLALAVGGWVLLGILILVDTFFPSPAILILMGAVIVCETFVLVAHFVTKE